MNQIEFISENSKIILTVEAASQATGGLLSERRIWHLVKEKEIDCIIDDGNVGIAYDELKRFLDGKPRQINSAQLAA